MEFQEKIAFEIYLPLGKKTTKRKQTKITVD
jgi:hypothetical protein